MVRILCLADGKLNFSPNESNKYTLHKFTEILASATFCGESPKVTKAHRLSSAEMSQYGYSHFADIESFNFKDVTGDGVEFSRANFDILFLFGFERHEDKALPCNQVEVIYKFMCERGGVFGTGDHGFLGNALCGKIPRLRRMRRWKGRKIPKTDSTRLSTLQISKHRFFSDFGEGDNTPQPIYPFFTTDNKTLNRAHDLLLITSGRSSKKYDYIDVLPDHAHEGECTIPTQKQYKEKYVCEDAEEGEEEYNFQFVKDDEFPFNKSNERVEVQPVAKSMSFGYHKNFATVTPKEFLCITAYDGHEVRGDGVGRIVSDSTWHHFLDMNLKGLDSDNLKLVSNYYRNIVTWLTPSDCRKKARFTVLKYAASQFPFAEVIDLQSSYEKYTSGKLSTSELAQIGEIFEETLESLMTTADIEQFIEDLKTAKKTTSSGAAQVLKGNEKLVRYVAISDMLRHVALGAASVSIPDLQVSNEIQHSWSDRLNFLEEISGTRNIGELEINLARDPIQEAIKLQLERVNKEVVRPLKGVFNS